MEPTATVPSSIEQYHAILASMDYDMTLAKDRGDVVKYQECRKLLRKLRARLVSGIRAVADSAEDDLTAWQVGFTIEMEPLADALNVSPRDGINMLVIRFKRAHALVSFWKETMYAHVRVEQLEAELEAAQCELFAY